MISAQQIAERGYQSVREALESVAGMDLLHDHYQFNLGVRGISPGNRAWSRSVKVMIDGQPISLRPSQEVWLVLAAGHPLAGKKTLTRADLRAHTLLSSSNTPDAEVQWFARAVFGRRPPPRLTIQCLPLTEAILDVARAGLGIAVLSEWIASPHLGKGDLLVRRLESGPLRRPWRCAFRPERAQAAERLSAVLQSAAPRLRLVG